METNQIDSHPQSHPNSTIASFLITPKKIKDPNLLARKVSEETKVSSFLNLECLTMGDGTNQSTCTHSHFVIPEDASLQEQEVHSFLDSLDLNQINVKEQFQRSTGSQLAKQLRIRKA